MREMAAPRSRVGAARRDRAETVDEERGRREIDNYPIRADRGAPKLTFPWRRCVLAICCLAFLAGCTSVLSGRRGAVAEISAADASSGRSHEAQAADGAAPYAKRAAPNPRADPLNIGDVLEPLVEVALLSERRPESAVLAKLPAKEPVTVVQVAAAESAERRWLRIRTASGRIGWVNYLSETGARIFSVEKKAQKAKRPQRPSAATKRTQRRPVQRKQHRLPQAKARRPRPGAASSWGKGAQPKLPAQLPAQPGRPMAPGRFGKLPAQRVPKRAVAGGGFGGPKPKTAGASRLARKPQWKASRSAPKASKPNAKAPAKRQR